VTHRPSLNTETHLNLCHFKLTGKALHSEATMDDQAGPTHRAFADLSEPRQSAALIM
jgi:hypothetical protein